MSTSANSHAESRPDSSRIPGYTYGSKALPKAPITLEELKSIQGSLLFGDEDVRYLRMSHDVLKDEVEAILDVWYGFVGSTPQLVKYFENTASGKPDGDYLAAVRKRFGQWILDTAAAQYDEQWLAYQFEIGRRHHRVGKNGTDGATSVPIIHFRYLPALHFPITATLKPFLAKKGHSPEEVEKMQDAWRKAVLLQVILWSYPYVTSGDF
ncbi:MAG: protoglobin domain-containing protein [Myxococcota bacterium]